MVVGRIVLCPDPLIVERIPTKVNNDEVHSPPVTGTRVRRDNESRKDNQWTLIEPNGEGKQENE
jgi:hypothetical protein